MTDTLNSSQTLLHAHSYLYRQFWAATMDWKADWKSYSDAVNIIMAAQVAVAEEDDDKETL